jgi:hypothetical protein
VKYGDDPVVPAELNIQQIFLDSLRQSNEELKAMRASASEQLSPSPAPNPDRALPGADTGSDGTLA